MADNIAITAGTGTNVATDDVGGVHYQRVKVAHGADGSAADVSSASPMPVTLTNLERAEDAAHSSGHSGIMALAVRQDTAGALSGATGDYNPLQVDNKGELRAVVGGYGKRVAISKTRPSNTTTYASGDVVNESDSAGTNFIFDACSRINGGSGVITRAVLADGANQTLKGDFELWVFSTNITADNDNSGFTPTDSDLENLIAVIPLDYKYVGDNASGASGNCVHDSKQTHIVFVCAGGDDALYGVLVVRNSYIPVSAETFNISLFIAQD